MDTFEELDRITAERAKEELLREMLEPSEAMLEASNKEWDGRMSYRSTGAWEAMLRVFARENNIQIEEETDGGH